MQATKNTSSTKKEKPKDDQKKTEEKLKKTPYSALTPREYGSKSSYSDIYKSKKPEVRKTPKKISGASTATNNVSPMQGLLKSSNSSLSLLSTKTVKRTESKTNIVPKKLPFTNITVNSPVLKRKDIINKQDSKSKEVKTKVSENKVNDAKNKIKSRDDATKTLKSKDDIAKNLKTKDNIAKNLKNGDEMAKNLKNGDEMAKNLKNGDEMAKSVKNKDSLAKDGGERQRTKTRTLDDAEIKILTPEVVDNNVQMMNLTRKLAAKPKVFYVDLEDEAKKPKKDKSSDEEVSYEDDFESYESDFDSYHSEQSEASNRSEDRESEASEESEANEREATVSSKEGKDEEKMLDSGNFDLRDRSAKTKATVMDFIQEDEENKKSSLTDEGFQEMSSSSAVSSIKTVEVLDRPLFIDFTKSQRNKQKRKINERLRQRAKDLLGMITLHEMSYSLFEMQPISYDLYMATFGRNNYTQAGVQTFDDGITVEVQTDEVVNVHKWTQHPIDFSKNSWKSTKVGRKYSEITEDYLTKFTFLLKEESDDQRESEINSDENYNSNPLRIYFEQKDGVGGDEILPFEIYKSKLKSNDYNPHKLNKFLKKCESKISNILSKNTGNQNSNDLVKSSKLPFSKGFSTISPKTVQNDLYSFLNPTKIVGIFLSDTKSNLILTVHKNAQFIDGRKSLICLWDLNVAREPIKILITIDDVVLGRFRGNTDGIFVAALEDSSIHLWDLSEEPARLDNVASDDKSTQLVEITEKGLTNTERDREWNLKNSNIGLHEVRKPHIDIALQSSAYTNSATIMNDRDLDYITGLEIIKEGATLDGGKKIIGQIVSLQRSGVITTWSIIQEKKPTPDIGKAFWSKMKLEKYQTIKLSEHIEITAKEMSSTHKTSQYFSLNAAKRRILLKKQESTATKTVSRPKSAIFKYDFDIDRPSSAASLRKKVLPVEINTPKSWDTGILCNDLKILKFNNVNCFLVAKNCGEVLCCKRCLGVVKVERFCVLNDSSTVTCLEVSQNLPQFLAATDNGTVNICSLLDNRVLLTLDCRNSPPSNDVIDKCQSDHKGRFLSSVTTKLSNFDTEPFKKLPIKSIHWSRVNPCNIHILLLDGCIKTFELTYSDIYTRHSSDKTALDCAVGENSLIILTLQGEVQIHKLGDENRTKEYLEIFEKYVSLL